MKFKPEMLPLAMKITAASLALAGWYFFGKPVDETQAADIVQLIAGILLGKEFLSQTGAK